MELNSFVLWLNETFAGFDYFILSHIHDLAEIKNGILTPFFKLVSLLGEKGIFFVILAIILVCFKKTRKLGIGILFALIISSVLTSLVIKPLVARPRPFIDTSSVYNSWWKFIGSPMKTSFSFPSAHSTLTMATMTTIFICCNKKYSWIGFIFVILMGISRNYLMVHYPSDVLGGIILGLISAIIAKRICEILDRKFLHKVQRENKNDKQN